LIWIVVLHDSISKAGILPYRSRGLKNNELAVNCTDSSKLLDAYRTVVDRYNIDTIDLDLEGTGLSDNEAGARRATTIAKLQSERRKQGKQLAVWATLPVTPQGLAENGTSAVDLLLAKHVDLAGVNAMTMDYGSSMESGQSMLKASESAPHPNSTSTWYLIPAQWHTSE